MGITEEALADVVNHLVEKLELESSDKLLRWAKKHGF